MIRRPDNEGDRHGGQVAFPGGGREPQDHDLQATALREAEEEVGLQPQDVQILGDLDVFHSISNYLVTPIVGIYPSPYPLVLQPDEVARAFTIPFTWLADPTSYRTEQRMFEDGITWPVIYYDHYDGELLWGFSAQVMLRLLEALAIKEKETGE
jgi:8-oxo-dGTP pyrophosphatase MutT (NUDIX family)